MVPERVLLHVGHGSNESLSFKVSCFLCPTAAVMIRPGSKRVTRVCNRKWRFFSRKKKRSCVELYTQKKNEYSEVL